MKYEQCVAVRSENGILLLVIVITVEAAYNIIVGMEME